MYREAFTIAALPQLIFGEGRIESLPELIRSYGDKALILTGGASFCRRPAWPRLTGALETMGVEYETLQIMSEPSPQMIDEAVRRYHGKGISLVVAIGGGSVMDAGKAIAGLLPFGNSVLDHLEGVGKGLSYEGPALPFIAVPTTAGTGSEATKNAVLSMQGEKGYKKSFRHDSLMAKVALLDPSLLDSCPPELMAAQGMDAFTQLLESLVSSRANPLCDALAMSGLQAFQRGFFAAWEGGQNEAACEGRAAMAYAAYLSGVTLAQVGLGSVHGLASPLGAFFPIPHGVVCGSLVAEATQMNIRALRERDSDNVALEKYAEVGRLLSRCNDLSLAAACDRLVEILTSWTRQLGLPRLSHYGVREGDIDHIVEHSRGNSMLTNPLRLEDEEIAEILRQRL